MAASKILQYMMNWMNTVTIFMMAATSKYVLQQMSTSLIFPVLSANP